MHQSSCKLYARLCCFENFVKYSDVPQYPLSSVFSPATVTHSHTFHRSVAFVIAISQQIVTDERGAALPCALLEATTQAGHHWGGRELSTKIIIFSSTPTDHELENKNTLRQPTPSHLFSNSLLFPPTISLLAIRTKHDSIRPTDPNSTFSGLGLVSAQKRQGRAHALAFTTSTSIYPVKP